MQYAVESFIFDMDFVSVPCFVYYLAVHQLSRAIVSTDIYHCGWRFFLLAIRKQHFLVMDADKETKYFIAVFIIFFSLQVTRFAEFRYEYFVSIGVGAHYFAGDIYTRPQPARSFFAVIVLEISQGFCSVP